MDKKALTRYINHLVTFSPEELETINSYFHVKTIPKGEYLLRSGQICRFEGYVVEGCLKVYTTNSKGEEKILYFAGKDWWVMEIDSFLHQTASELSIRALKNSTLLTISWTDKERLYAQIPKVERLFRIMSQKAIAAWQRRLIRNHTMTAEERYLHFIDTYPTLSEQLTNKHIASYLGITQEFVSVIRKRRQLEKT
ncbi:Crp/Fnr family transcriptional regulator [Reichenbachiella agariperforans]|uniref:Crp/Fnr family transcriptional regulator n=1 Tax=Reichenbachiella agariperforans TaxID=156994 RepID=UPI001C0815F3|nr:Crp/Fnr family transcriptional regulator [Reichenbachiella agariperforans]MBU2912651.1 Crp/Fnr family transcriptional regulator [Reichenbachiella agariperforans]